jgi:rSAM/selenodomain-associated transferase 2
MGAAATSATAYTPHMISVVIPTLNAAERLPSCLSSLLPAAATLLKEVIVVDGGSEDLTKAVADAAGARVMDAPKGRGAQLAAGAAVARGDYILFLHADTALEEGWVAAAEEAMRSGAKAAAFTLAFDAKGFAPRLVAFGAMLRTRVFALPYGDQGLLIRADVYRALGGFRPMPLMEDVDFIDRFVKAHGRGALRVLKPRAVTSPERYERDGYARRVLRNQWTLLRYRLGEDPAKIAAGYVKR